MTTAEVWTIVISAIGVVVNACIAVLAVYGKWISDRLTGPKLRLELKSADGATVPPEDGKLRTFYQFKVVNDRPSAIATSCRVHLKKIWRRTSDGRYVDVPLPFSLLMSWTPAEMPFLYVTIRHEETVDFGFVFEGAPCFVPAARVFPNNLIELLGKSETMRFGFEIVSDQFVSKNLQIFEVWWNREWSKNPDQMRKYLKISETE
jgi:hypothetical protein